MNKRSAFALLLACLLTFAACAERGTQTPAEPVPAAPEQTEQPQQPVAEPPAQTTEPERPEVESNGGQFVRVGDRVWFRRYGDTALDETQLWGNFLGVWPSHGAVSTLCWYDEISGSVVDALPDDGFGPLWYGADGFYLTRVAGESAREAYFKTTEGAETVLREGRVAGVSDNGRFAAVVSDSGELSGTIYVYEGTEQRYAVTGDVYDEFCALTDDGALILYRFDFDAPEGTLVRTDEDGRTVVLGVLPELGEYFGSYPVPEQCLIAGDDVWCTFGVYEGTGHFLAETLCVRAKTDAANSLEAVEDQPTTEYPYVPKLWRDENGEVLRLEHIPYETSVDYDSGDLIFYDAAGDETVLIPAFLAHSDDSDDRMIEQSVETIRGAAYLIIAEAYRDEENDIGWRWAYQPGQLRYLRVPLTIDPEAEPLDGLEWETVPAASVVDEQSAG